MAKSIGIPVRYGDFSKLAPKIQDFILEKVELCKPKDLWICDGSVEEDLKIRDELVEAGQIKKLPKYKNCVIALTDPKDVARVEKCTYICTPEKRQTCPIPADGAEGHLANWISPDDLKKAIDERFPGCMAGRTMFVIPFSMCPVTSPIAKIGIELTDSGYVTISMRIMTRMGSHVLDVLGEKDFIRSLHSVGCPLPMDHEPIQHWPCNPSKTIIAHIPAKYEIWSYGSGYGGNSLLGKKCFSLRLGSNLAREEGWLAEHMLILGLTNPEGETKYITGAFPSCSGKTNLAMITPSMPGWKAECVGDDIAWMFFDDEGQLRAINPEYGFFGVCPGTSDKTNHVAMETIFENTIFTNVAQTSDGGVWWEGLPPVDEGVSITSWKGTENWKPGQGTTAAHPNSRFCTPAVQCPILDPLWEDPKGVPISAILFGGRRPRGVPLVIESFDWTHGVFLGASCRSESTAAAEHKGKKIMHDPMAMRPFFGYNTGDYFAHWLSFGQKENLKLPKIFMVNWFRVDENGKFLWPGFGENARVLEWILQRCSGDDVARESAIGMIPKMECLDLGKEEEQVDMNRLFEIRKHFWLDELDEIENYFNEQIGDDLPQEIRDYLAKLRERCNALEERGY